MKFNQTAFNRQSFSEITASLEMAGIAGIDLTSAYLTTVKTTMDSEAIANINFAKITFTQMTANGVGSFTIPIGKLRTLEADWQGVGTFAVNNESFTIYIMEYYGVLNPNDRVIINTDKFTVTKNNANALEEFDGNFIDLKEGINELVFEDSESSRTILMRVEHRDRFL